MIYKGDNICRTFMASIFGENCVEWIHKLSFKVDFTLVLNYHMGWREMYQNNNNTFNFWFDTKARPICAQTVDGKPLNTTDDVADYYSSRFWDMYGPYMEECREDIEDSARAIAEARGEVYESYR